MTCPKDKKHDNPPSSISIYSWNNGLTYPVGTTPCEVMIVQTEPWCCGVLRISCGYKIAHHCVWGTCTTVLLNLVVQRLLHTPTSQTWTCRNVASTTRSAPSGPLGMPIIFCWMHLVFNLCRPPKHDKCFTFGNYKTSSTFWGAISDWGMPGVTSSMTLRSAMRTPAIIRH